MTVFYLHGWLQKMKGINQKYVELLQTTFKKYEKIDIIQNPVKQAEVMVNGMASNISNVNAAHDNINKASQKVTALKRLPEEKVKKDKDVNNGGRKVLRKPHNSKLHKGRSFTVDEDEIIWGEISRNKIVTKNLEYKKFGKVAKELALKLGRSESSVKMRLIKLQRTGMSRKIRKQFTLEEDCMILDATLENLKTSSLHESNITDCAQLSIRLNRNRESVFHRWDKQLKTWLLGYFTGTLNLDIKMMLANSIAERFDTIESIDWDSLSTLKEFSSHTAASLQMIFRTLLVTSASRHLEVDPTELTLKQITDDTKNTCKSSKVRESVKKRQLEIIEYFENIVNKNDLKITV